MTKTKLPMKIPAIWLGERPDELDRLLSLFWTFSASGAWDARCAGSVAVTQYSLWVRRWRPLELESKLPSIKEQCSVAYVPLPDREGKDETCVSFRYFTEHCSRLQYLFSFHSGYKEAGD